MASRSVLKIFFLHTNHQQCFDLESYITANSYVSGGRWRCSACENFVSLQNLEVCGLTLHLLRAFARVATSDRSRVALCGDRTYKLLAAPSPPITVSSTSGSVAGTYNNRKRGRDESEGNDEPPPRQCPRN